jgi:hypothetical protein
MKTLESRILLTGKDATGAMWASASAGSQRFIRNIEAGARRMRSVGTMMTLGLTLPLLELGRESVKQFIEYRSAAAQVEVALKSMYKVGQGTLYGLERVASALSAKSLYDQAEILEGVTAQLLRFGNVHRSVFGLAEQAIVDYAARTHVDLQAATKVIGRALNDPLKAGRSMLQMGIALTKEQTAWIKKMIESHDVAKRHTVQMWLLTQMNRRYAGAAEAAAKADPIKRLAVRWKNIKEEIGKSLVGPLDDLLGKVETVMKRFDELSPRMKKWIVEGGIGLAAMGPAIYAIGLGVSGLVRVAGALRLIAIGAGAVMALDWAGLAGSIGAISLAFLPEVALIVGGAALIGGAAYLIWKNWKPIKEFFSSLWSKTVDAFKWGYDNILPWIPGANLVKAIIDNWTPIAAFFDKLWNGIVAKFRWATNEMAAMTQGMDAWLKKTFPQQHKHQEPTHKRGKPVDFGPAAAFTGKALSNALATMLGLPTHDDLAKLDANARKAPGRPAARAAAHHAATQKVDIGKGQLDVRVRIDANGNAVVTSVNSKSPKNLALHTGVDNTGSTGVRGERNQ